MNKTVNMVLYFVLNVLESSEVLPLEKSDVCLPNEKECEYRDDSQSESAILHSGMN